MMHPLHVDYITTSEAQEGRKADNENSLNNL